MEWVSVFGLVGIIIREEDKVVLIFLENCFSQEFRDGFLVGHCEPFYLY